MIRLITKKIEYTQKAVTEILNGLEETTSQFGIESVGRSGNTDIPGSLLLNAGAEREGTTKKENDRT